MKTPSKYVCDICGQEIEFESTYILFNWRRRHYNVKMITCDNIAGQFQKPEKIQVDICEPCYRKMAEWIKTQRKESICES